jgi:secreted trypsin-like serine protease
MRPSVMKKLLPILAIALAAAVAAPAAAADPDRKPLIVGGVVDESPDVGWIASLNERGRYACSGSLVAPSFVLTAAHCTAGTRARHWTVRLDSKNRVVGGEFRRVRRILTFPRFSYRTAYGDMALLRLRRAVAVEPVRLVPHGTHWIGHSAYIAGWGQTSATNRRSPRWLNSASIPIRPDRVCQRAYSRRSFDGRVMLCAGNGLPDTCSGDSGGPLARWLDGAWHLVGVTSFGGLRCNSPSVYAWVGSSPLRGWLRKRLGA